MVATGKYSLFSELILIYSYRVPLRLVRTRYLTAIRIELTFRTQLR